ncbi:hypothetical protein [Xanthocytophaga agilis]|uniref:Beta-carotene 15,15'-monooxygenase n=1 Tax=Xanthocytophaga agilis TaxID=3048010 RepID=A0AAE3UF68_9BACT|nr:hypothetical protein [Xanthocytophaga agilis]MDJ1503533.1 hypothetical protein [Xanthocytophaga agilis]
MKYLSLLLVLISLFACSSEGLTSNAEKKAYDEGYELGYKQGSIKTYRLGYEHGIDRKAPKYPDLFEFTNSYMFHYRFIHYILKLVSYIFLMYSCIKHIYDSLIQSQSYPKLFQAKKYAILLGSLIGIVSKVFFNYSTPILLKFEINYHYDFLIALVFSCLFSFSIFILIDIGLGQTSKKNRYVIEVLTIPVLIFIFVSTLLLFIDDLFIHHFSFQIVTVCIVGTSIGLVGYFVTRYLRDFFRDFSPV